MATDKIKYDKRGGLIFYKVGDNVLSRSYEHIAPQIKLGLVTTEDYEFTRTKAMHINRGI